MPNSDHEKLFGLRLEDQLAKRRAQLQGTQERERRNPFEHHPLETQQRIEKVFDPDIQRGFFFFARTYFPEYVPCDFCQLHFDLVDIASSTEGSFHLVAAPPEHGKSIILLIWKVYAGIRGIRHKVAQISEDKRIAKNNIGWVAQEFEMNWRILADFGELIVTDHNYDEMLVVRNYDKYGIQSQFDHPYTGYAWFGHNTTLKGFIFYQYRIDYVEFDDYEPIAKSKNKELVQERIKWIFSEVEGRTSMDSVMLWIHNNSRQGSAADTLHHEDRAKVYSDTYPAHDGRWNPLWADKWSPDQLQEKKLKIGTVTWQGDWMQDPITQGKIFKLEQIKLFTNYPPDTIFVCRIDFSPGSSKQSAFKALVIMGWSPTTKEYYVSSAWVRQDTINALVDACYWKYENWMDHNLLNMKIEKDFRQDLIYNPYFQMKADEKGYRVPVGYFEVKGMGDKDSRVSRCESPMSLGIMNFPRDYKLDPDLNELVQHILAWDYGQGNKRLDGADAWASCYHDLYKISLSYSGNRSKEYHSVDKTPPRNI